MILVKKSYSGEYMYLQHSFGADECMMWRCNVFETGRQYQIRYGEETGEADIS